MMTSVFVEPDWNAAVDFEKRLAAIPPNAQVRGMFLQLLTESIGAQSRVQHAKRRYVGFKNYPMREYVELLARSCTENYPKIAMAERVRRLGRMVYPNYANTLSGTAIFAAAGRSFRRVVELCPAAYRVSVESSEVTIRTINDGHALVELRNLWNIPEFHQVGIWEGAMLVCRASGSIKVQVHSPCDVDMDIQWVNGTQSLSPTRF
jgi:uncharacterized protein (TIGR02265 family)